MTKQILAASLAVLGLTVGLGAQDVFTPGPGVTSR